MPSTTILNQSLTIPIKTVVGGEIVGCDYKPIATQILPLIQNNNNYMIENDNNKIIKLPYVVQLIILEHCLNDPVLNKKWKLSLSLVSWSFHNKISKLNHKLRYRESTDLEIHINSPFCSLKRIEQLKSIDYSLDASIFNGIDLSHLRTLVIKSDITPSTLSLVPRLTSLTILKLLNPIDNAESIVSFLELSTSPIEYLHIQNIMIGDWQPIINFIYKQRSTLKHLLIGIVNSSGLDLLMKSLKPSDFKELETLDIWARGDMAAFGKHISTFPKLKHLNIANCNQFNSLEQSLVGNSTITRLSLPQIQTPLEFRYKGNIEQWMSSMPSLAYLRLSPLYLLKTNVNNNQQEQQQFPDSMEIEQFNNNSNDCRQSSTQLNRSDVLFNLEELVLEPFNSNAIDISSELQLNVNSTIKHLKLSFIGQERKYNQMLSSFIRYNKSLKKITCDYSDEILAAICESKSIESIHFLNIPRLRIQSIFSNIGSKSQYVQSIFIPYISIDNVQSHYGEFAYCPSSKPYHFFRNNK